MIDKITIQKQLNNLKAGLLKREIPYIHEAIRYTLNHHNMLIISKMSMTGKMSHYDNLTVIVYNVQKIIRRTASKHIALTSVLGDLLTLIIADKIKLFSLISKGNYE